MSEDTKKSDDQVANEPIVDNKANRALLDEKKQLEADLKKYQDAEANAATEAARKAGEWETLEKKLRDDHAKELAKRDDKINALNDNLRKESLDNTLLREITNLGVLPDYVDAAFALLKSQAVFKDGVATIKDKPLTEAVSEWAASKQGSAFVRAADSSGSDAIGSTSKGASMTAETWNYTKWAETLATNPAEAKATAIACGKSDLADSINL